MVHEPFCQFFAFVGQCLCGTTVFISRRLFAGSMWLLRMVREPLCQSEAAYKTIVREPLCQSEAADKTMVREPLCQSEAADTGSYPTTASRKNSAFVREPPFCLDNFREKLCLCERTAFLPRHFEAEILAGCDKCLCERSASPFLKLSYRVFLQKQFSFKGRNSA